MTAYANKAPSAEVASYEWRLAVVPLSIIQAGLSELIHPNAEPETGERPPERQFAAFEAFSRNHRRPEAVAMDLQRSGLEITRDEVITGSTVLARDYYGAKTFLEATNIAIRRGDIRLGEPPARPRPQPSTTLKDVLDGLSLGLSVAGIAKTQDISQDLVQKACDDICLFYDRAANLATALRRSYEWGHRQRRPTVDLSNAVAGLALSPRAIDLKTKSVRALKYRAQSFGNAEAAVEWRVAENTFKDWGSDAMELLEARTMGEAIAKAVVLGIDIGLGFNKKLLGRPTKRQIQIGIGACLGLTYPQIAKQLFLSETTVKTHTKGTRANLGAKSRTHTAALMLDTGLLVPVTLPADQHIRPDTIP
jgi:DNA-binding NarL/FixJ family response regulator